MKRELHISDCNILSSSSSNLNSDNDSAAASSINLSTTTSTNSDSNLTMSVQHLSDSGPTNLTQTFIVDYYWMLVALEMKLPGPVFFTTISLVPPTSNLLISGK